MKTISITDIAGFRIGQAEDAEGATGASVIICPSGMAAGISVRGGGPASRDTRVLDPLAAAERIHAVLLAGGSAYGLDAAGGVMRYLEEHGIGLEVGPVRVPLVCQSDIFDLLVGSVDARPDAAMGYAACVAAEAGNYRDGNFGAGCGATVGKALGADFCMKTGIGSYAVQVGDLQVGALVAVNALGDVRDPSTGATVAGLLDVDKRSFRATEQVLYALADRDAGNAGDGGADVIAGSAVGAFDGATGRSESAIGVDGEMTGHSGMVANTTIGAVLTNATLTKSQLCKVADMAHDGFARAICPVHTSMDGDSIYALSTLETPADTDLVGILAADAMAQAILVAARSAEPAYGLPSARSLAS